MIHRKLLVASALALALNVVVLPTLAAAERAATPNANDIASLVQTNTGYPVKVSVYATGLDNPRGLKFGPDGYLYVAEGGRGANVTVPFVLTLKPSLIAGSGRLERSKP